MPSSSSYHAARRADPEVRVERRRYKAAYQKALAQLRSQHPGEFGLLLRQQLADQRLAAANAGLDDSWREDP